MILMKMEILLSIKLQYKAQAYLKLKIILKIHFKTFKIIFKQLDKFTIKI